MCGRETNGLWHVEDVGDSVICCVRSFLYIHLCKIRQRGEQRLMARVRMCHKNILTSYIPTQHSRTHTNTHACAPLAVRGRLELSVCARVPHRSRSYRYFTYTTYRIESRNLCGNSFRYHNFEYILFFFFGVLQ